MPEGDTLRRTADGLRPHLIDRIVLAASARTPGPRVELLVGARVEAVEALGKNLLVRFDSGLELRTHLGLHGTWHRYRPSEAWRRSRARARLVLEVEGAVAVCFDARTVELLERRAEALHPPLGGLGPDLLAADVDEAEAVRRLRAGERVELPIAEALLDQRALAGIGNVYKSEVLFMERVAPFAPVATLDGSTLARLVARARLLLVANADRRRTGERRTTGSDAGGGVIGVLPGRSRGAPRLWVYGRVGRPCLRCGTRIASRRHGTLPRVTYWCPACQPVGIIPNDV